MTTEKLLELLKKEIELNGSTYTEKRKAIEEMLRMKGVRF
jgi:transposase-like protein